MFFNGLKIQVRQNIYSFFTDAPNLINNDIMLTDKNKLRYLRLYLENGLIRVGGGRLQNALNSDQF